MWASQCRDYYGAKISTDPKKKANLQRVCVLLLSKGADPNVETKVSGYYSIHDCVLHYNRLIVFLFYWCSALFIAEWLDSSYASQPRWSCRVCKATC